MIKAEKPELVPGSGEVDPIEGFDVSNKELVKPIALACGIALAGSFAAVSVAQADSGTSPFAMTTLSAGYMLAAGEGACGEGSCGGDDKGAHGHDTDKAEEGACGEGSCGEGSCGGNDQGAHEHDAEEDEDA